MRYNYDNLRCNIINSALFNPPVTPQKKFCYLIFTDEKTGIK